MGSPTFGFTGSGGPMFGSQTNPTGGSYGGGGGNSFPSFPLFGNSAGSPTSSGLFNSSNLAGLFKNPLSDYYNNTSFWNQVGKAYGVGTGQALQTLFGQMFNPQVVASFLNAQQPGINQGQSNIMQSFGAEGNRFGSTAALGDANYMSQVNLNEQQTIASMYQNATGEEANIMMSLLPSLHAERANSGGWMHDVLGGLEIAGGIAAAPFSGGLSLGMVGSGLGQLGQGLGGGSGSGGGGTMGLPMSWNNPMLSGYGMNENWGGSTGGVPNSLANDPYWNFGNQSDIMQVGGGMSLGGANPWSQLADPNSVAGSDTGLFAW